MKKVLVFPLFFSCYLLLANNNFYLLGGRSIGMAGASVTLSDFWSAENNQAALGFVNEVGGGLYYENRFGLKEMSIKAGAFAYPLKFGTFGLSVSSYGFKLYNENKAGISYGQKFSDKLSAGVQLNYVNTQLGENYGKRQSVTAAFGIMAKLSNELTLAAHLYNPTRNKISNYNNERSPTIMRLGIMYKFSEKILLAADVDKNISEKVMVKSGLEYHPINILYFRIGIATNPTQNNFGIGIQTKELRIDIATGYHTKLGFSPAVSIAYQPFK
jgi:hypothetical protein